MDKKAMFQRITLLTSSEDWQQDKEIKAEVTALGQKLWADKRNHSDRKIAVLHEGKVMVIGTAEELSTIVNLNTKVIKNRAWSRKIDAKGRQFKFIEEKTKGTR